MDICGPQRHPSGSRTLVDGFALALLLVAIFWADRFDLAADTIGKLRDENRTEAVTEAAPGWLTGVWGLLALGSALLGTYVACRIMRIAKGLAGDPNIWSVRTRRSFKLLPWLAYGAVALWTLWQLAGMAQVEGHGPPQWIGSVVYGLAIAAAVLALAGAGGAVVGDAARAQASVVRLQLVLLLVLFIVVFRLPFAAPQVTDVLRAWGDGPASRAFAGIAAALLLGAVIRGSASRLLLPADGAPTSNPASARSVTELVRPHRARAVAAVVALAAVIVVILQLPAFGATAFAALGIALIAVGTGRVQPSAPDDEAKRRALLRLAGTLGTVPLAILLVGLVSATADSLLLPSGPTDTDKALIAWTAVVIVLFAVLAARAHAEPQAALADLVPDWCIGVAAFLLALGVLELPDTAAALLFVLSVLLAFRWFGERGAPELWAAWGAGLGVAGAMYREPIEASRDLGAFGLAMFGATAVLAVLHAVGSVGIRRCTVYEFGGRARSAPVVTLLALWVVVAWVSAPERAHQARTVADGTGPAGRLDDAVRRWLRTKGAPVPEDGSSQYVPMLIVAASGGGSKAAYWTDLVLDCLFGDRVPDEEADECGKSGRARDRRDTLFLTSSVSGGSIGIHHLVNHPNHPGGGQSWVVETAGRDVLSPMVAWGIFHDLPSFLLGLPTDPSKCGQRLECPLHADRALVQEGAIGVLADASEADVDAGLLAQSGPVTVFNGTVGLWDRRRVLLSRVGLAPAPGCGDDAEPVASAVDGHDVLRSEDVPLVTATMLSARFPGLEPPARLGESDEAGGCDPPSRRPVKIRDGGLVENSGLMTVVDLLPAILSEINEWERHNPGGDVRPIIASIDDDVQVVEGDDEYRRGFWSLLGFDKSAENTHRAREQLNTSCSLAEVTYVRISPSPHAGAQAATGWEVSETSRREDLGESLRTGASRTAVSRLQDMLDGSLPPPGCSPPAR